jgi:predicted transcriptional regulator
VAKKARSKGKNIDERRETDGIAEHREEKIRQDSLGDRLVRSTEAARHLAVHLHQVQRLVARLPESRTERASPEAAAAAPTQVQAEPLESAPLEIEREFRSYPMPDELLLFIQPLRASIKLLSEEFNADLLWLLAGLLYPHGFRIGRYRAASAHELAWKLGSMELEWMLCELQEICIGYVSPVVRDGRELITDEDREAWIAECEADNEGRWKSQEWSDYEFLVRELHEAIRDFNFRRLLIALDCEHGAGLRAPSFTAPSAPPLPPPVLPEVLNRARGTKLKIMTAVRDLGSCHYKQLLEPASVNLERVCTLAAELHAAGLFEKRPNNNRGKTRLTASGLEVLARAEAAGLCES